MLEEQHWANSLQQQCKTIDKISRLHRRSSTDLLDTQRAYSELIEEYETLQTENKESYQEKSPINY